MAADRQLPHGLMLVGTPGGCTCGWCSSQNAATHTFLLLHPWAPGGYSYFCDRHARAYARRLDGSVFHLAVPAEWPEDWRTETEGSEAKREGL